MMTQVKNILTITTSLLLLLSLFSMTHLVVVHAQTNQQIDNKVQAMRKVLIVKEGEIEKGLEMAKQLGVTEVAEGIPPRYKNEVTEDMLPYVYEEKIYEQHQPNFIPVQAGGNDVAEFMQVDDPTIEEGNVVSISERIPFAIQKSKTLYDRKLLGIISTNPGVILGSVDGDTGKEDQRILALAGRVPVKVSTENGPIEVGDYLTSSSTPGVAMKATKAGPTVGKALEAFDGTGATQCPDQQKTTLSDGSLGASSETSTSFGGSTDSGISDLSSNNNISQSNNDVNNQNGVDPRGIEPLEPDLTGRLRNLPGPTPTPLCGKTMSFVNVSWYDPDALRSDLSDISISLLDGSTLQAQPSHLYTVSSAVSGDIKRVGAFDNLALGTLTAGAASIDSLNVNHITVGGTDLTEILSSKVGFDSFEVSATPSAQINMSDVVSTDENGETYPSEISYDSHILGVGSSSPDNVILSGKALVKVSTENGPIKIGDFLTSSTVAGVAMKAIRAGPTIGKALESYDQTDPTIIGRVLVFVNVSYADPNNFLAGLSLDPDGNLIAPKIKTDKLVITDNIQISAPKEDSLLSYENGGVEVLSSLKNLDAAISSASANLASLQSSVVSLQIDQASKSAELASQLTSAAAEIAQTKSKVDSLNLTPPDTLYATGSAQIAHLSVTSEASVSGMLTAYQSEIQDNFKVFGQTTLGKTNIAGDVNIDGTLSIENGNTINAISILHLQSSILAEGIDIFDGQVIIDKEGNITTQGKVVATEVSTNKLTVTNPKTASGSATLAATIGKSSLPANKTKVTVSTTEASESAKVFITPTTPTDKVLSVTNIKTGESFDVSILTPASVNIDFNWWIIQTN